MTQKAIMIAGPLSEADLAELLGLMRQIEQCHPESTYRGVILDLQGEPSIDEMEQTLQRIFPRVPGKEPFFATKPRRTEGGAE